MKKLAHSLSTNIFNFSFKTLIDQKPAFFICFIIPFRKDEIAHCEKIACWNRETVPLIHLSEKAALMSVLHICHTLGTNISVSVTYVTL